MNRLIDDLAARDETVCGAAGGASGQLPLQTVKPMCSGSPFSKGCWMVTWLSFTARRVAGRTRLGLSTHFTYSDEYEWWSVHRTRLLITGTIFLGSRSALAQEVRCPGAELDRYPEADCSVWCFENWRGDLAAAWRSCNAKSLRETEGGRLFWTPSKLLPLDPRHRL